MRLSRRALGAVMVVCAAGRAAVTHTAAAVLNVAPVAAPEDVTAKAVYVFDRGSGVTLFARDPDLPLPPASLTKIVAALVILDRVDLDQPVTIEEGDIVSPEESQVGLIAGDVLTARDLLFGALIPSGNDATLALARTVGAADLGENATSDTAIARFVELMNEKLVEIGATSSHMVYPTGVDREGHVMSARDVATASAAALGNPLFAEIVSTQKATLTSQMRPEGYEIFTTNDLLVEGLVNGVKTGSTPQAGGCLSTSFDLGPGHVVSVVLGSKFTEDQDGFPDYGQRFTDTRALMSAAESDYVWLDLTSPDTLEGLTEELAVWDVALPEQFQVPVPVEDTSHLRYRLRLTPPDSAGSAAGELQVFIGDSLLLTQPTIDVSQSTA